MKLNRMYEFYLVTIALLTGIWVFAPTNMAVVAYKAALITLGVVIGEHLAKRFLPPTESVARAIVIAAVVLGMSLGL